MVIKLVQDADAVQIEHLENWLKTQGITTRMQVGPDGSASLQLLGSTETLPMPLLMSIGIVADVKKIKQPYKGVAREGHTQDTVVEVGSAKFGGGEFSIIAGPCSVESEVQITQVATSVKKSGASLMRGGAFKPRTSPYAFQGLGTEGLALLLKAKEKTGLPIVTEVMDSDQLPYFEDVDVIQVGARNMQNFELLKKLGKLRKPILLKRGLSATIEELLMSAEYIMSGGNDQIILCERGIRTFETAARNTLDISAVPILKQRTHLPVVVDPSHGTGHASLVVPMSLAAVAAGADGLIIEVHNDPENALCDGPQSLTPAQFNKLACDIAALRSLLQERGVYNAN